MFGLGEPIQQQKITSTSTSRKQVASLLKIKSLFKPGTRNLDLGGGPYGLGIKSLESFGVESRVADPIFDEEDSQFYDPAHNRAVDRWAMSNPVDTVTVANLLNVIRERSARKAVIQDAFLAVKSGGQVYFQIYNDPKKTAGETKDGWQEQRPIETYLPEVRQVFGDAQIMRVGTIKIIVATKRHAEDVIKAYGLPGVDRTHGVGKRMGNDYYVHKSAEDAAIAEMGRKAFDEAKSKLPADFEYDLIHVNKKTGAIEFIASPDWDTASEPSRGEAYKVTSVGTLMRKEATDLIYHHKWSFVRADYTGFDVEESAERSVNIGSILPALKKKDSKATSKYGNKDYWEKNVVPLLEVDPFKGVNINDVRLGRAVVLTPEQEEKVAKLKNEFPPLAKILSYLTPSEQAKVYSNILKSQVKKKNDWLKKAVKIFEHIPTDEEYAAVAFAGRAKRGWYTHSTKALIDVFGVNDAPRFAALLAALSPQTSVEMNLENTLKVWTEWVKQGRPGAGGIGSNGAQAIIKILANNVRGASIFPHTIDGVKKPGKTRPSLATMFGRAEQEFGDTVVYKGKRIRAELQDVPGKNKRIWVFVGGAKSLSVNELREATNGLKPETVKILSVLPAWQNNSIRALDTNTHPSEIMLSGPKVDSFMWNLRGFVNEVTSDTHMANFAFMQQAVFGGTITKGDPGKGPGYIAVNAAMRSAAEILTKQTGEVWTPAEIQETIWSWTKVLSEKREAAGEDRTVMELANELTAEDIDNASDFADLFAQTAYRAILEGVPQYAENVRQLATGTRRGGGGVGQRGKPASAEGSGFAPRTYKKFLKEAAKRLEEIYQIKLSEDEIAPLFGLAYHGTGSEWEALGGRPYGKPDLQYIGVGEGAQAFGWGVYFAESKGVAGAYRSADRFRKGLTQGVYTFQEIRTAAAQIRGEVTNVLLSDAPTQYRITNLLDRIKSDPSLVGNIIMAKNLVVATDYIEDSISAALMYTLEIDDTIVDQMLDWDTLLSNQNQNIQDVAEDFLAMTEGYFDEDASFTSEVHELDTLTGRDFLRMLVLYSRESELPGDETLGGYPEREASEFLARHGIPGIKYFEGGQARRTQKGNRNYVIFDQNVLDDMNVIGKEGGAVEPAPTLQALAMKEGVAGGLSTSELRKILVKRFGSSGIIKLEMEGILEIVESVGDLPVGLVSPENANKVRGFYNRKNQTAYLIANNLTEDLAVKYLLHEVGTHFGLARMMGTRDYARLVSDLYAGRDKEYKVYFDRVLRHEGYQNLSEAKLAEEVLAQIAMDTSEATITLRERIWNAIREFLKVFDLGGIVKFSDREIGFLVQGSLQKAMSGRSTKGPLRDEEFLGNLHEIGVQAGYATIVFPDNPTRRLTDAHRRYDIVSAVDNVFTPEQELRLRRNMDGMMKVAEQVAKRGYKNVDVHLPVVVPGSGITSRYAMFKNTKTGTELVIRMSDHPKDMNAAASAFPFLSFNNGHKIDKVDLSDVDKAVKLLSQGKLEGMNGLQFQFEYGLGEGIRQVSKSNMQKFSYSDFLRALGRKDRTKLQTIQELATVELTSAAIVGEEGILFGLAPDGTEGDQQAVIRRTMGGQNRRSMSEWINDARHLWMEKRVQNIVDAYRPVRNRLGDDGTRAWQMMHLSENTHGMLHSVLHFGRPKEVYRNGEFDWYESDLEGEGLVEVLRDLGGEADRFMAWMTYVRANRLSKEDREKNFTEAEIKIGLGLNKETVGKNDKGKMADGRDRKLVYAQAMQKMSKFQRSILDLAVNAGVISKQMSEELETDFYVPFYREFTKDEKTHARGPTPVHDFVNIKDVIRKLRGSELDTNDVLHNVMMNWTALMGAAMKNRAGVTAMEAAEKSGAATKLTDKKLTSQLSFAKGKTKGAKFDNFVYVLVDGERVWYEVHDPLVLNSMVHLAWGGIDSKAMRVLSTFKRWLTLGVTASPAFKIRNLIRDSVHAIAVGKMSYNFFGNASSGLDVLKKNNVISNQMMMGGATFHFGFYNDDPASIRRMINAGISESRILNTSTKIKGFLENFWKPYADVGNRMENANRAALYMQRKEEVGHLAASFEARDLLNFSSHGRGVAVQWLTSASPFLNARLQGMDKLIRSGQKGSRARLLAVVGTVTLASILLRMSYEGDEDYEELEEWQKNTYWPLRIPGTKDFFFLPKPFEIGAIATVGERITENFVRRMHEDANQFGYAPGKKSHKPENFLWVSRYTWSRIGEIISDQLAMDWRPQVVRPFMEVLQNKNAFTDRQIENITWDIHDLPNELRVRPYTSYLARNASWAMGEMLDIFGQKDQEIHLSPVQIDHLIKGYFGWLGATITGSFDLLGSPEVEPSKRLDEMRGWLPAGSFIAQDPRRNSKYITLFYDQMKEINKFKSSYDAYKREYRYEEAARVVEENKDVFTFLDTYDSALDLFSTINKRIGYIYDDPNMTPKEKREEIDKLNEQKVDIAKKVVITRAEYEEKEGMIPDTPLGALRAVK